MPPALWERRFWLWGPLLWLSVGSSGSVPPTAQPKCTDFQNASFLRGTNLKVQFLLFTPSDPSCGQLVEGRSDIQNSKFNVSLGTKLIIHGFRALGTKPSWIDKFIRTLLRATDANVIAVDWVYGSTGVYLFAVDNVVKLSLEISRFLSQLLELGVSESSIHIIGVSLGAHVGGMVGQFYKGQLGRITGLDPAGPEFTRASMEERLDAGDALFVEAIHTDTDYLGIRIPVGHVDYFVNGGQDQPGCPTIFQAGYSYLICDHMRAVHLYISALENTCPLMAFPCASYKAFLAGDCLDCFNPFLLSCPRIGLVEQGGVKIEPLPKEVRVYLVTTSSAPYCACMTAGQKRAPDLITDGCEPPCGCWELNSRPLEEQPVLLTSEPSLKPKFVPSDCPPRAQCATSRVIFLCCFHFPGGSHSPSSSPGSPWDSRAL